MSLQNTDHHVTHQAYTNLQKAGVHCGTEPFTCLQKRCIRSLVYKNMHSFANKTIIILQKQENVYPVHPEYESMRVGE